MSGPIVRTGTTPKFWENWDQAFGKKKRTSRKKTTSKKSASSAAPKKSKASKKGKAKRGTK